MKLKHCYILVILAPIFFMIYSYVSFTAPPKFDHPDESVNYFFTDLYSKTGELSYSENLNEIAYGTILHRNTIYIDGKVTTCRFIGFPLINGTFATMMPEIIRFLTPLLAVIGAFYLYLLTKDIFNKQVALLSFLLLLILPPYWHANTLVMLENTASSVMLIISIRYFFKLLSTNQASDYLLSGLFFGLTLFIRPDYILFSLPLLVIILWHLRRLHITQVALAALFLVFTLGPFFILNNRLYDFFLYTGQHVRYGSSNVIPISSFNTSSIYENSIIIMNIIPLLIIYGVLGTFYVLKKRAQLKYAVFSLVGLLTLTLYFLSGPIESHHNTLHSSSYVRYFLPIFLLFLPFLSSFILGLRQKLVTGLVIFTIVVINVLITWPVIISYSRSCNHDAQLAHQIVEQTNADSIIFLSEEKHYYDKIIFPERRVGLIENLPTENRQKIFSDVAVRLSEGGTPIYLLIDQNSKQLEGNGGLAQEFSIKGYQLKSTKVTDLFNLEKLDK